MKLISWNVNGVRAAVRKGFLDKIDELNADVICLQETKAQDDQFQEALIDLEGYHKYHNAAVKKGYSSTAIISKEEPIKVTWDIGVKVHDTEGRVLMAEYKDFQLINVYVPNSGSGLKRLEYRATWDKAFKSFIKKAQAHKPVVLTGDLNVAREAIDLARPKENYNKTSGYTQKEIDGLESMMKLGLLDSYRKLNGDKIQYTFWNQRFRARDRNVGWRIDYFLVDKMIADNIVEANILDQVMGSDHCPIELILK